MKAKMKLETPLRLLNQVMKLMRIIKINEHSNGLENFDLSEESPQLFNNLIMKLKMRLRKKISTQKLKKMSSRYQHFYEDKKINGL